MSDSESDCDDENDAPKIVLTQDSLVVFLNASDDDLIAAILSGTVSFYRHYEFIFNDRRLNVMQWIYSVMRIEEHILYIYANDKVIHQFHIYTLIDALIDECQMEALESLYQQIHSQYDFGECTFNFEFKLSHELNVKVFDWWYGKFGTDCMFDPDVITDLLTNGNISMLNIFWDTLASNDMSFEYEQPLRIKVRPLEVLNWLWDHLGESKFIYDDTMLTNYWRSYRSYYCADQDELIDILNWLWSHYDQLEFKYNDQLFNYIPNNRFVAVLQWFYDRRDRLEFKYQADCMNRAAIFGFINILDFFYSHRNELPLKYTRDAVDLSDIVTRQWFYDRKDEIEFKYSALAISFSIAGTTDTIYEDKIIDGKTLQCMRRVHKYDAHTGETCGIAAVQWFYDRRDVLEFLYDPLMATDIITKIYAVLSETFESRSESDVSTDHAHRVLEYWFTHMSDVPFTNYLQIVETIDREKEKRRAFTTSSVTIP
jgi:hypothetical protein